MATTPSWQVATPWSICLPSDRPLTKYDIQGHGELLPGHGPNDLTELHPCTVVGGDPTDRRTNQLRCALPYLIPQSTGLASRLVFCWAFHAPLVAIREVGMYWPQHHLGSLCDYRPESDAMVREADLPYLIQSGFIAQTLARVRGEKKEVFGVVVRIDPDHVAVAPVDTPVHDFTVELLDYPGN
jgi:hypothetical protein